MSIYAYKKKLARLEAAKPTGIRLLMSLTATINFNSKSNS
jgi:hypothetical protein